MNLKTWLLLLVALLTGGAAALGVKSIFFSEADAVSEGASVASSAKTQILVANVDLPVGSELTAQNVRLKLALENEIPRERTLEFREAVGALTARDLKAGEPITLFDVAQEDESAALEETYVKPGCSIVPIEIQAATKAGGGRDFLKTIKLDKMLKPGDVVDLAVVKEEKSAASGAPGVAPRRRLTTETIVAGVEVFSVSDASRFSQETGAAERSSTVCLQLSQEQLAAALKAAEQGRVKILPRVESDDLETGDANAPLAFDGNFSDGAAFEPPMNADFSFSGLTQETTAPETATTRAFESAVDEEPAPVAPTSDPTALDDSAELAPFEIAVDEEPAPVAPTSDPTALDDSAELAPFEIAVDEEPAPVAPTSEPTPNLEAEEQTPFRLRNASVRSDAVDVEEAEESDEMENVPNETAVPVAPTAEPRQASVAPSTNAPSYRTSAVESSVAEETTAGAASNAAAKNFKPVSPFVLVNKKGTRSQGAAVRNLGAPTR